MRREVRKRKEPNDVLTENIVKYTGIGITIVAVIVFALLIYSKNLNNEVKEGTLSSEEISSILNSSNTSDSANTQSASTDIGKSVNEVTNEINKNTTSTKIDTTNVQDANKAKTNETTSAVTNKEKEQNTVKNETKTTNANGNANSESENKNTESNTTLNFEKPVEGDIVKDFATDNLIFSETLQEWTVHTGIDIKADKTTVVKSAEAGTVKTIKNDPRYGLTIIVEHSNGFQTVYSNLLTSEFVVEGESVKKGQSLGTVGNTAAFEIADEPHLHFEILKDMVSVDPNIYLK